MARLVIFAIVVAVVRGATEPFKFKWKASLERDTGIATSCEESLFVLSTTPSRTHIIADVARRIIRGYPKFLTRTSLTLGLLKTNDMPSRQTALCTSICNSDLLSFGSGVDAPRTTRKKQARKYAGNVVCCVEIPILGGLLSQSTTREKCDSGCLRFTLIQSTETSPDDLMAYVFVTEIAGSYQPSIAGEAYPRSKFRSAVYCATQRMFHEYVMWRFHRTFREELRQHLNNEARHQVD